MKKKRVNNKLTLEEVKQRIESIVGFRLLSKEYTHCRTQQLEIECNHGHVFKKSLTAWMTNSNKCQECQKEKTLQKKLDKVKHIVESVKGYKLLSKEYKNKTQKLEIQCNECGNIFKMTLAKWKAALIKCPICRKKERKSTPDCTLSYEEVKNRIESDPGFKLMSKEYIHTTQYLEIECPSGHLFERPLTAWKNNGNNNCPICQKGTLLKYEDVKALIESKPGFKLVSKEYWHSRKQKLDIQCPSGHIFQRSYHKWYDGSQYCPESGCKHGDNRSKGENYINSWLMHNEVEFIREYTFNDCRGKKKPLPFDFLLPDHNLIIEFDGAYHYEHVNGRSDIETRKKYDAIKNKYCKAHGINLLRIPYWKLNQRGEMDRILTQALATTKPHDELFNCEDLFLCAN